MKLPNHSQSYLKGHDGLGKSPPTGEGATSPPFLKREKRKTWGTTGQSASSLFLAR